MDHFTCDGVRVFDAGDAFVVKIREQLTDGRYERDEATILKQLLRDGDQVMEVGSGVGFLSSLSCLRAKDIEVTCYEAHPGLIEVIKNTHALNGVGHQTEVNHAVLMTQPTVDTVPFYTRKQFWASSLDGRQGGVRQVVDVPVRDANAEIARLQPTVFVCDIEGGELELVKGLDLSSMRFVVMEVHPKHIGREGVDELISIFEADGLHYDQDISIKNSICFVRTDTDTN